MPDLSKYSTEDLLNMWNSKVSPKVQGDTRIFQQYDPSVPVAKKQLTPAWQAISDPFQATIGNDSAAQGRIAKKVAGAMSDPMMVGAIKAFHGTPHTFTPEPGKPFGSFKSEHMGSGEGAQAFGYGHYSAENPNVARDYQQNLSERDIRLDGKRSFEWNIHPWAKEMLIKHGGNLDKATDELLAMTKSNSLNTRSQAYPAYEQLMELRGTKRLQVNSGHLLELSHEWPDPAREAAEPLSKEHLLDWDKPLSEQSEKVQKNIRNLQRFSFDPANTAIAEIQNLIETNADKVTGRSLYNALAQRDVLGEKGASDYLNYLGIPGIKYLDAGSRSGGGTHNFVMFSDDITKITKRDGLSAYSDQELIDMLKKKEQAGQNK